MNMQLAYDVFNLLQETKSNNTYEVVVKYDNKDFYGKLTRKDKEDSTLLLLKIDTKKNIICGFIECTNNTIGVGLDRANIDSINIDKIKSIKINKQYKKAGSEDIKTKEKSIKQIKLVNIIEKTKLKDFSLKNKSFVLINDDSIKLNIDSDFNIKINNIELFEYLATNDILFEEFSEVKYTNFETAISTGKEIKCSVIKTDYMPITEFLIYLNNNYDVSTFSKILKDGEFLSR